MSRGQASVHKQSISFLQVNLNKAHAAQVEVLRKINKLKSYIALLTEPYCYKQKICMIPRNSNCLPQLRSGQPRACIISSKNLKIHEINELKNRDLAIGLTKLEGKSVVIVKSLHGHYKTNRTTTNPNFRILPETWIWNSDRLRHKCASH